MYGSFGGFSSGNFSHGCYSGYSAQVSNWSWSAPANDSYAEPETCAPESTWSPAPEPNWGHGSFGSHFSCDYAAPEKAAIPEPIAPEPILELEDPFLMDDQDFADSFDFVPAFAPVFSAEPAFFTPEFEVIVLDNVRMGGTNSADHQFDIGDPAEMIADFVDLVNDFFHEEILMIA